MSVINKQRFPRNDECDSWLHMQNIEFSKRLKQARCLTRSIDNDCYEYNFHRSVRIEQINMKHRKKIWKKIY